jgi:2-polyprenyl-3-methyl-5-hydroxy-6-metoxy-1,4-benzoquinol methylase
MKALKPLKKIGKQLGLRTPVLMATSSHYRKIRKLAQPIIASIRRDAVDKVHELHRNSTDGYTKYFHDLDWNIEYVVNEALQADLVNVPPQRVLDIGCGPGYFLYALQQFGHDVVGLDVDWTEIFNDLIKELKIPRIVHAVEAFKPMPPTGEKFDVITALGIVFDMHRTPDIWGPKQWEFFLADCRSRLRPGGRVFLRFNPATTQKFDFIRDDVAEMLRKMPGGKLSESKEIFLLTLPG